MSEPERLEVERRELPRLAGHNLALQMILPPAGKIHRRVLPLLAVCLSIWAQKKQLPVWAAVIQAGTANITVFL